MFGRLCGSEKPLQQTLPSQRILGSCWDVTKTGELAVGPSFFFGCWFQSKPAMFRFAGLSKISVDCRGSQPRQLSQWDIFESDAWLQLHIC